MRLPLTFRRLALFALLLISADLHAQQFTYTQDLNFQTITPTPARAGRYQLYPYGPAHFVAHASELVNPAEFNVYDSIGQPTGLKFTFHPSLPDATPQVFLADASGRAYIAGTYRDSTQLPSGSSRIAVAKFLPNGDPDSSWGQAGFWRGDTTTYGYGGARKLQVLASGAVLLIDNPLRSGPNAPDHYLRRLTATGQLDSTFGMQGSVLLNPDHRPTSAFYFAEDGSAYACTNCVTSTGGMTQRWLADGTPDTSFVIPGYLSGIFNILLDGRIVSDGHVFGSGRSLRRHWGNGAIDSSFQAPAINLTDYDYPLPGGGRIIMEASYNATPYPPLTEFSVVLPDGTLDPAYMPAGQPLLFNIPPTFWPGPGCHNNATPSFGGLLAMGPRRLIYADAMYAQVPTGTFPEYEYFVCPRIVSLVTDLQTVGQAGPSEASSLTLWPNPVSDHFSLRIPARAKSAQVQLYDLAGKVLSLPSPSLTPVAGDLQYDFQGLGDLPAGLYLLRVMAGGQQFAVKLRKD